MAFDTSTSKLDRIKERNPFILKAVYVIKMLLAMGNYQRKLRKGRDLIKVMCYEYESVGCIRRGRDRKETDQLKDYHSSDPKT